MLDDKKIIAIASDHAGFELKREILSALKGVVVLSDLGTNSVEAVDYPDMAKAVVNEITSNKASCGILICGTGIGMSIAANRTPYIRAALCTNSDMARLARAHNNANILVLGAKTVSIRIALDIVKTFMETEFEEGRHATRIAKIL
jgi:ribose 5-phosphate isomerase B